MTQINLHHTIGVVVILLAILGCVLPAQTIQPTAGIDPNAIETSIVGTLEVSAQQTEQATLITPTVSLVPTQFPTPKISSLGTSLTYRSDGSTQFTDHTAGMRMVFPTGWLVIRMGEEEYYAAWEKKEIQNPKFLSVYSTIQDQDPKVFRVHALDTRPEYARNGIVTDISVVFQAEETQPLEEWERVFRNQPLPYKEFKFLSSSYPQTNNGMRVLVMEASWLSTDNGTNYGKYVFFSLPSGTVHLDFETSFDHRDVLLPELDQVLNSIEILNP
jgi:hypothetical protein